MPLPMLQSYIYWIYFNLPFVVEMDASDFAIGSVLTQADQPVAYFSMMFNSVHTCNYPVHDHELLAIIKACK